MSNKDRLIANNQKIEEIRQTLARKQVSPTDMLQARVDATNSCKYLFYYYGGTDLPFVKNLDTSNVTSMDYMFYNCLQLNKLDLTTFDTSNVTNMNSMFASCQVLTELDISDFDTSKVTNMSNMFYGCKKLPSLDLSSFDTSKVTLTSSMFRQCGELTSLDLSSFNTSNVTNMEYMFNLCTKLTSLDVSNFNTSKVTNMSDMFSNCTKLTSLNVAGLDTSKVTGMSYVFNVCADLTTLDLTGWDTSKATTMAYMFSSCSNLKDVIGTIDCISSTNLNNILYSCYAIENITFKNIKKSIQLGSGTSWGTKLSDNSIINTFQELHELTGQTLTLSTTSGARTEAIYVKLIDITDDMRANDPYIDNKKPCVVCEPTDAGAMTLKEYGISKGWSISY